MANLTRILDKTTTQYCRIMINKSTPEYSRAYNQPATKGTFQKIYHKTLWSAMRINVKRLVAFATLNLDL